MWLVHCFEFEYTDSSIDKQAYFGVQMSSVLSKVVEWVKELGGVTAWVGYQNYFGAM